CLCGSELNPQLLNPQPAKSLLTWSRLLYLETKCFLEPKSRLFLRKSFISPKSPQTEGPPCPTLYRLSHEKLGTNFPHHSTSRARKFAFVPSNSCPLVCIRGCPSRRPRLLGCAFIPAPSFRLTIDFPSIFHFALRISYIELIFIPWRSLRSLRFQNLQ